MAKSDGNGSKKHDRVLEIYSRLLSGEILKKENLASEYGVSEKSIQRDIDSLRDFCSGRCVNGEEGGIIEYDHARKGYVLRDFRTTTLTNAELYATVKILIESRSLNKTEMETIANKIIDACLPPNERNKMKTLTRNEIFHYVEPKHGKALVEDIWTLGSVVVEHKKIKLVYKKANGEITESVIKPVGIMYSEFYFYLIAYVGDTDKKYPGYPTVYRMDRIENYTITDEKFDIPYSERFQEGEFQKRIPFMYTGRLTTVRFEYTGTDINAVLDRLPTAKAKKKKDGGWSVTAEVFGEAGFQMWARSQGNNVRVEEK